MKGQRALDVKKISDVDIVVVTNNVLPSLQYIHFHCLSCTFSVFSLCNMAHQSLTRRRCYKPPPRHDYLPTPRRSFVFCRYSTVPENDMLADSTLR